MAHKHRILSLLIALVGLAIVGCGPKDEPAKDGEAGIKNGANPSEAQKDAMRNAHMPKGGAMGGPGGRPPGAPSGYGGR